MKTTKRMAAVAMLALVAFPAHAVFHLWRMTEIYSSADGNVQYLELAVSVNGEGFLADHTLTSTYGGLTRTYGFTTNLTSETADKTLLVATEGFAALNLVVPDYIVPNGFFSIGGGTVNFAEVDLWTYPALPGGGRSINRAGVVATNTPKNFAGMTGTLAVAALNFQALWWGAPAGSESGWGLNLTHQGDILFGTWFTYDTDGSAMWLVAPSATRGAGDTYSGKLYRTTGPAFNSVPFNPAAIGVTEVGSATFTITDPNNGTFGYTVNGVTQSKAITRQLFDVVSTCSAGGTAGARPNYQDLWWRAPAGSESGWGVNLTHQGDILFATWFTYDAAGKGMWIVMPDGRLDAATGRYSGKLYRTTGAPFNANPWNPASIAVNEVGSGSFSFTDLNAGTFAYTVNGITQSKAITRQSYAFPATVCR